MILFDDLRITRTKETLFIDCSIKESSESANYYISKAELYHYSFADSNGNPTQEEHVLDLLGNSTTDRQLSCTCQFSGNNVTCIEAGTTCLTKNFGVDSFDKGLFFVRVVCSDTDGVEPDVTDIGVVVDWAELYACGMQYVASLNKIGNCNLPVSFEQFIYIWFGLRMALYAEDYNQVKAMWERFLRVFSGSLVSATDCRCS